jgi:hypothetical protein
VDVSDIPKRGPLKARRESMTENDPILDVYERFKHLDRPISEAGQDEDPFHKTCAALWVAVKKHRAQAKKEKTCKTCGWSRRHAHDRTGEFRVCVCPEIAGRDGMEVYAHMRCKHWKGAEYDDEPY